jgi:hypothetical protein
MEIPSVVRGSIIKSSSLTPQVYTCPVKIVGTYYDNYDIIEIHKKMISYFDYLQYTKLAEYKNRCSAIDAKLENKHSLSYNARRELMDERKNIETQINKIVNQEDNQYYKANCSIYLIIYQKITQNYNVIVNGQIPFNQFYKMLVEKNNAPPTAVDLNSTTLSSYEQLYQYRHEVIEKYISKCSHIFPIDLTRIYPEHQHKSSCDCPINSDSKTPTDNESISGTKYCAKCGTIKDVFVRSFTVLDVGININRRETYDGLESFSDAVNEFQGKTDKTIPCQVYDDLDKYFGEYHLPTRQTNPILDERGRCVGTNKQIMFGGLKKTNNAQYYSLSNCICKNYWKWKLLEFPELTEILIDDYKMTQCVWNEIQGKKSTLLIHFRLFKHLQARQVPCYRDDFKMIVNHDILKEYDATWKLMIEGIVYPEDYPHPHLKFIPTI